MSPSVLGETEIVAVLQSLPEHRRQVVLIHSSLSACGKIRGGAPSVVRALREWTGQGTLAMPTHTYCYPDPLGVAEVFDPSVTRSRVGAVTEAFWREAGVLRSRHPTHSLAAVGPAARGLVTGHELTDTPCGAGTPYERLVQADAGVLMFGVTLNSYTLFHTAEALASVPYLYFPQPVTLREQRPEGGIRILNMRRQDMGVARRFEGMDSWLEERGLLHRVRCGEGSLLWLPHARAVHEALMDALRDNPWLLVDNSPRTPRLARG